MNHALEVGTQLSSPGCQVPKLCTNFFFWW